MLSLLPIGCVSGQQEAKRCTFQVMMKAREAEEHTLVLRNSSTDAPKKNRDMLTRFGEERGYFDEWLIQPPPADMR
jgi:hypothetical protein